MKCKSTSKSDLLHSAIWAIALLVLAFITAEHDYADKFFLLAVLAYVSTQTIQSRRSCRLKPNLVNQEGSSE